MLLPSCTLKVIKLQAAIKYAEEDLPNAKVHCYVWFDTDIETVVSAQTLVEQCVSDDPDTDFNMACVLFKVQYTTSF